MFELSREDMCQWRKEHNQIDKFIEMPNIKKLEQSNVQKKVKIVKMKQQKKIPDQSNKKEELSIQEMFKLLLESSKRQEESSKRMEENLKNYWKTMEEGFKRMAETMDGCLKNMSRTLNSTSEGIIVNPKTEESGKGIEIREDQNAVLSENKNRKDKEKIQTIEAVSYTHLSIGYG